MAAAIEVNGPGWRINNFNAYNQHALTTDEFQQRPRPLPPLPKSRHCFSRLRHLPKKVALAIDLTTTSDGYILGGDS